MTYSSVSKTRDNQYYTRTVLNSDMSNFSFEQHHVNWILLLPWWNRSVFFLNEVPALHMDMHVRGATNFYLTRRTTLHLFSLSLHFDIRINEEIHMDPSRYHMHSICSRWTDRLAFKMNLGLIHRAVSSTSYSILNEQDDDEPFEIEYWWVVSKL